MEKIFVAARIRPFTESELKRNEQSLWKINKQSNSIILNEDMNTKKDNKLPKKEYKFTSVFDEKDSTFQLYDLLIHPLILSALEGINCTIFTYGQTGSGKTFTMFGHDGLIFLSMKEIFDRIELNCLRTEPTTSPPKFGEFCDSEAKLTGGCERAEEIEGYNVRASFFEVYNEKVIDLMGGERIEEREVKGWREFIEILKEGEGRRTTGRNLINHVSSRSHTIFRLTIRKITINEDTNGNNKIITQSNLTFVDLAGNERIDLSRDLNPSFIQQRNETKHINKSLFHLNYVISLLSSRKKKGFVPYRNSLLTKILRSSLGGNARTCIVLCLHPGRMFVRNSLNSVRFGMKAKMIVNKISKNILNNTAKNLDDLNSSVSNESKLTFDEHAGFDFSSGNKRCSINATPNKNIQLNYEIKELKRNFEVYTQINVKALVKALNEIRNENLSKQTKISNKRTQILTLRKTLFVEEREKFRIMNENDKLKQMISFYQNNNDYGIQRLSLETLEILDKNTMQMLEKIKEQKILVKYNLNNQSIPKINKLQTTISYFNDEFYTTNTAMIEIPKLNELKANSQNKRRASFTSYSSEKDEIINNLETDEAIINLETNSLPSGSVRKGTDETILDIDKTLDDMLLMGECILDDLEKLTQENSLNI